MTPVELLNVILSLITALSASYIAFAALRHSARPRASVVLKHAASLLAGKTELFVFAFRNRGYWYATPMIVEMTIYLNFDGAFDLLAMRSGSTQQIPSSIVKIGKGHMKYFKSVGMHLSYGEDVEEIHVMARTPTSGGRYRIKVSAFSENGVSLSKVFWLDVLPTRADSESPDAKLLALPEG